MRFWQIFMTASAVSLQAASVKAADVQWPSGIQIENLRGPLGATADVVEPRPMTKIGLVLVQHFEGWSAAAYDDPVGYCTIGYGHLIALRRCARLDLGKFANSISLADGLDLLKSDTALARAAVHDLVKVDLDEHKFSALSSFVFNVGSEIFRSRRF